MTPAVKEAPKEKQTDRLNRRCAYMIHAAIFNDSPALNRSSHPAAALSTEDVPLPAATPDNADQNHSIAIDFKP